MQEEIPAWRIIPESCLNNKQVDATVLETTLIQIET